MNYIKPTLSLLDVTTNSSIPHNCETGTVEAKELEKTLEDMGFDISMAFNAAENCALDVGNDYCKFTSGVMVFYS